jgi:F0F1-type ATP synthase epsilon subunit
MKETDATMHVRISKATEVVWQGNAYSVSSSNEQGPFDILPMHANFITLVKATPIRIKTEQGEDLEYTFTTSVIYVANDQVRVYADIT